MLINGAPYPLNSYPFTTSTSSPEYYPCQTSFFLLFPFLYSSSSTFIDNKESYKQISCVEHFYMRSNIFNRHIFVLQET